MNNDLQRTLEEIIFEKHEENKLLKAQIKELQSAKIRDVNPHVDYLYNVIAQEQTEKEHLEKQVAELKGQLATLRRVVDGEKDQLFEALVEEQNEREYFEKQVAELKGRLAKMRRVVDEEFP